ncbi:MAG TPA: M1 family aminopeptidase [Aggregatilineaceae bacterium]|nr:M1 family aminopeptidase [Aggregatilineaceae bacterium]
MQRYIVMVVFIVCLLISLACQPESKTSSERRVVTQTPRATVRPALVQTDIPPTALPDKMATDEALSEETPPSAIRYDISAELNWTAHTMQVEQQVTYRNSYEQRQNEVVFNVEVNQEAGDFTLKHILADKKRVDYSLTGTRLVVDQKVEAQTTVHLTLSYTLNIPATVDGYRKNHLGYWGYGPRQLNLGMWFPLVAGYDPYNSWLTPAYYWLGEQSVTPSADFYVDFSIKNAPDEIHIAGPGKVSKLAEHTWRFELQHARDLVLSVSEQYRTLSTRTDSGVTVELFYFPTFETLDTPRYALQTAVDALALYEKLYNPYPYGRMVIVEGDFPDGMEFSGLVFVSEAWFRTWQGVPNDWLTLITAHEVAHQWWYCIVGSDQGNSPYLDEALALYSEVLYLEHTYPELVEWWWQFRVTMYTPSGYVDSTVYDFYSPAQLYQCGVSAGSVDDPGTAGTTRR